MLNSIQDMFKTHLSICPCTLKKKLSGFRLEISSGNLLFYFSVFFIVSLIVYDWDNAKIVSYFVWILSQFDWHIVFIFCQENMSWFLSRIYVWKFLYYISLTYFRGILLKIIYFYGYCLPQQNLAEILSSYSVRKYVWILSRNLAEILSSYSVRKCLDFV